MDINSWLEKHKPKKISDLCGNQDNIKKICDWIETKNTNKPESSKAGLRRENLRVFKACIISGKSGIGKTTTAHVILEKYKYKVIELNSTNIKGKSQLKELIINTLTFDNIKDKQKKAIIVDEFDVLYNSDKRMIPEIKSMLKDIKSPIIFICDKGSKRPKDFIKECIHVEFDVPDKQSFIKLAKRICKNENSNKLSSLLKISLNW